MDSQINQLLTLMETNIQEIVANKLKQEELKGILVTVQMTLEELTALKKREENILLKIENEYLKEENHRQETILTWYRKNVSI